MGRGALAAVVEYPDRASANQDVSDARAPNAVEKRFV